MSIDLNGAPDVDTLARDLGHMLESLGLAASPNTNGGTSYLLGHSRFACIDLKPTLNAVRVDVGAEAEAAAPARLRGDHYRQKGWLFVHIDDLDLARAYIRQHVVRRLLEA